MQNKKEIDKLKESFKRDIFDIKNLKELENFRIKYFGRSGLLNKFIDNLKDFNSQEKREWGPILNSLKEEFQKEFEIKKKAIEKEISQAKEYKEVNFDVTAYKPFEKKGSLHVYSHITSHAQDILISMGYKILNGPEVESEYHNFDALNIPENHPARDMQDTFWLTIDKKLMRTHTSTVQIHTLKEGKLPISVASLGRCYRNEATDASHDFMFMQLELLFVDKFASVANLIATIKNFLKNFLNKDDLDIRLRPSYFPFVQPGFEIDISCIFCDNGCQVCKFSNWIEIGGAGLVHPNVLISCNIDPDEYNGFAFGLGITRLTMLIYKIPDIRLLHSNKLDFLKQF